MLSRKSPLSLDRNKRTVNVTFATPTKVRRIDPATRVIYDEELVIDKKSIRMDRLNNGASLLASHRADDLNSIVGVIERAWVEGTEGRATVRFSERPDQQWIMRDVQDGIIRNVSVGYIVHRYEKTESANGKTPVWRAVDWEPMEISLVPIPADAKAQIRSSTNRELASTRENPTIKPTVVKTEETSMTISQTRSAPALKPVERIHGWRNFGEFLQAVGRSSRPGNQIDTRLVGRGLNGSIGSEGGFLVSESLSTELLEKVFSSSPILSRLTQISMTAKKLSFPVLDNRDRREGSRLGGLKAEWHSELSSPNPSKPKLRDVNLTAKRLTGFSWVSNELVTDSSVLGDIVEGGFIDEYQFKILDAAINGYGAGSPLGILNSDALITASKESGQTASTITSVNVIAMRSRLAFSARANAVWLVSPSAEAQISALPEYDAQVSEAAPYGRLLGLPVFPVEQCAEVGKQGDIISVDMSQYLFSSYQLRVDATPHYGFVQDEMLYRFILIGDGQPMWDKPQQPAHGSVTQSAFVALEARS